MPVGAYGGRRDVMSMVSPVGPVYQAGTLSGNPVAMQAGMTQLKILKEHPEIYTELNAKGDWFYEGLDEIAKASGTGWHMNHIGSLGCMYFTGQPVVDYASAKQADTKEFAKWFRYMLQKGYYFGPSQFESMFLSAAHTREELQGVLDAAKTYFAERV